MSDTIKLWTVYLSAAVIAIGSLIMAAWAWATAGPDQDLAIMFGMCGTAFGAASSFLFVQEGATRAVRSYERGLSTTVQPTP